MKLIEKQGDIFNNLAEGDWLFHCISLDCAMGAGVAKEVEKRNPGMKQHCKLQVTLGELSVPTVIHAKSTQGYWVANGVTKKKCWQGVKNPNRHRGVRYVLDYKEYLNNLRDCLCITSRLIENENRGGSRKRLIMPRIASDRDNCDWEKVREVINDVFENTDIEVVMFYL